MSFILCVILILVAMKCGKAMFIEFGEGSSWGWMWLAFGAAAIWGIVALASAH